MTWEERLIAMGCLAPVSLHIRKVSDWYANMLGVSIRTGSMAASVLGNGVSPQTAVDDLWRTLTTLKEGQHLIVASTGRRRFYEWVGFMWKEFPEEP